MRKLIYISILLTPFVAFAITGGSAKFDFTNGEPSIVDDQTSTCNDTATIRYDFTAGQPDGVLDATANCTLAVASEANTPHTIFMSQVIINSQTIIP